MWPVYAEYAVKPIQPTLFCAFPSFSVSVVPVWSSVPVQLIDRGGSSLKRPYNG